jgi:hypothetical protein
MLKDSERTFYCFSAPVMLATFVIEIVLALFLLFTRKTSKVVKLGVALLVCLAIFQLAEYGICEQWGLEPNPWAKVGFTAITLLPPIGLHLVYAISGRKTDWIVRLSYVAAAIWIAVFLFGTLLKGAVCTGNYVIFEIPEPHEGWYYLYYDALLIIAMTQAFMLSKSTKSVRTKAALQSLVIGYLAFIIPSIFFTVFDSYNGTDSPLPSIMCGFAVLLAIILTFKVVPNSSEKKK